MEVKDLLDLMIKAKRAKIDYLRGSLNEDEYFQANVLAQEVKVLEGYREKKRVRVLHCKSCGEEVRG